ncbi:MAG TPA: lamin tail domain-containing protein, partial [Clostridia bacterium]|nr:lamin tail domain-containing protein [Clostridia bacterium]
QISVVGIAPDGQMVPGASNSVAAVYNGTTSSPVGQVVINEIMYQPSHTNAQYVEFFNHSTNLSFDLSGWEVRGLAYSFPAGSLIGPGGYLVLAADRSAYAAAYGATNLVFDAFSGILQPDGETLSLIVPGSNSVSELAVAKVRYSASQPWPAGALGTGSSLQLIDSRQDSWRVGNWSGSFPPLSRSPGARNTVATNLTAFPPLWINEVQAQNLTGITNRAGGRTPWIELYNPSSNVVSLAGLYLANSYTNLNAWAFPAGASLNPRQFKIIFVDGLTNLSTATEWHTSFSLVEGNGSVILSRVENGQMQVLDYVDYVNLTPNRSFGSYPDGQSFARQEFFYVSPGANNNGASAPLTVRINEWMAGNTRTLPNPLTGKYSDWFELYNYGTNTAYLGGYYLTDNLTNQFQFQIPPGYSIPPGGYLLVWADGRITNGTPDLHIDFKLSKSGESLGLFGSDGVAVDYVTYGTQTDDVSEGRYPDGAPNFYPMLTPTPRTRNVLANFPPALEPIADRFVILGQSLALSVVATDPDQPAQTLTYSLGSSTPAGASINSATGFLTWNPTTAPSTNLFTVIVRDNGNPSLSVTQSFKVIVHLPPQLAGAFVTGNELRLSWGTLSGQSYQLEYCENLTLPQWSPLGGPVIGTGTVLEFPTDLTLSTLRFYRLRVLP